MQHYLWLWLLLAPPILALIDLMTSPSTTSLGSGHRDRWSRNDQPVI